MNRPLEDPNLPSISGKWIILGVAFVAVAGAGFAWWYRMEQADEALAFWGPTAAELIAEDRAEVELLRLAPLPAGETDTPPPPPEGEGLPEVMPLDGEFYGVQDRATGDQIKGLIHLRHALTQDASFDFAEPPADDAPWPYALRLSYEDDTVLLLFDPQHTRTGLPGGKTATLRGPLAENLGGYFEEMFAEPGA